MRRGSPREGAEGQREKNDDRGEREEKFEKKTGIGGQGDQVGECGTFRVVSGRVFRECDGEVVVGGGGVHGQEEIEGVCGGNCGAL